MTEEDEEFERIKRRIELETLPLINFTKQKEWVGLTDEDEIDWDGGDLKSLIKAVETKLKQKNGYAEEKNT